MYIYVLELEFTPKSPIPIQYCRVHSIFFSFTLTAASLSQNTIQDSHYPQLICSALEHTKNDFRIANLCFCRKRGLLTRVKYPFGVILFLAQEHVVAILRSEWSGFASSTPLHCDYVTYLKLKFFPCPQFFLWSSYFYLSGMFYSSPYKDFAYFMSNLFLSILSSLYMCVCVCVCVCVY